jgi:hypothetical protein
VNVETRGRAAAQGLRSATAVDVEAGLLHLRRTRRRRDLGRVVATCAVVAAVVAGAFAVVDRQKTAVPPAKDPEVVNGQIVNAGDRQFGGVSTLPSERPYPLWQAVDPTSGAFLYASESAPMVVVDQSGTVADIECAQVPCDLGPYPGNAAFGPGEDEVTFTIPEFAKSAQTLRIVGYDGEVRKEIDLSAAGIPEDVGPSLIAWSPDGRQLAMAMDKTAEVWLLAGDGGGARLLHREEAPQPLVNDRYANNPVVVDLAWSPDGSRLGILVANDLQREEGEPGSPSQPLPRLITVPAEGGEAQALHTFDFRDPHGSVPSNYIRNWAFAWSPDGTRIAVTNEGGIAEISATNGTVLAEHEGVNDYGPLVWLLATYD